MNWLSSKQMSSLYYGLDVFCLFQARVLQIGAEPLLLKCLGSCGRAHHGKFRGSSLEYAEYIEPKKQRRRIFAALTMYHRCHRASTINL